MATPARIGWYGSAGLLVLAGAAVIVLCDGVTAEAVAISLISLGLIGLISLMFFEVGRSEDRERAREQGELERRRPAALPAPRRPLPRPRPRRRG